MEIKNSINNKYDHCYYCVCDNKCAMIYNLYIIKEYRRKGYATELIKEVIARIKETGYKQDIKIVADPEEGSISKRDLAKFYEGMGLKIIN